MTPSHRPRIILDAITSVQVGRVMSRRSLEDHIRTVVPTESGGVVGGIILSAISRGILHQGFDGSLTLLRKANHTDYVHILATLPGERSHPKERLAELQGLLDTVRSTHPGGRWVTLKAPALPPEVSLNLRQKAVATLGPDVTEDLLQTQMCLEAEKIILESVRV